LCSLLVVRAVADWCTLHSDGLLAQFDEDWRMTNNEVTELKSIYQSLKVNSA